MGFFFSTWFALLLYWEVFSGLTPDVVLSASAVSIVAGLLLRCKGKKFEIANDKLALIAVGLVFGTILVLNVVSVFYVNENGGISAIVNVWGDGPLHLSIINSFATGQNHPPAYPLLLNSPLTYPFLTDFSSAVLVVGGFDWRSAVLLLNILLSFSLVSFTFFLAREFSKSSLAAALLLFLFFFNGNFGIMNAVNDFNQGKLLPLQTDYSRVETWQQAFMNITYFMVMPQRSALLGFAGALLVLWLLYRFISQRDANNSWQAQTKAELLLAGVVSGLLPLAHTHSFLVVAAVSFYWFLTEPRKEWFLFFVPMVLLSLPQVAWITQHTGSNFMGMQVGWIEENAGKNIFQLAWFWVQQLPIAILLAPIAFFLLTQEQRKFVIPFIILFLIANVIRFQPYPWDNIKILLFPVLVFLTLAAVALDRIWNFKARSEWLRKTTKFLVIATVVFSIAGGILSVLWIGWGENARYEVFPNRDLQVAEWIKANTPSNAVFLTSDKHNHLVPAIAGRSIVMGYPGWLWTHGVQYSQQETDVKLMYLRPDCSIFRKYGVSFVFVGPQENDFHPNTAFFEKNFEKVFDQTFDKYYNFKIYRVKC